MNNIESNAPVHTDSSVGFDGGMSQGRTDEQIVLQTEALAAALANLDGFRLEGNYYHLSKNPRASMYWSRACIAQDMLTSTDANDAVSALEDEFYFDTVESRLDSLYPNASPLPSAVSDGVGISPFEAQIADAVVKAEAPLLEQIGKLEVDLKKARIGLQAARSSALEEAAQACIIDPQVSTTQQFALGVEWCSLAVRELAGCAPTNRSENAP
jgi:hypothetical protein